MQSAAGETDRGKGLSPGRSGMRQGPGRVVAMMEKSDSSGREEKKKELFRNQKQLLDTFLKNGAISQAQYDKSLGDLIVKMGIDPEEAAD